MSLSNAELFDEEMKKLIQHVAVVCLSDEFASLRRELETLYFQSGEENAATSAFQDALLALLAEDCEVMNLNLRAN